MMLDEKDPLLAICRHYAPTMHMAFMGGSRGASMGDQRAVSRSDYDIVVLAAHTRYPVSYNHVIHPVNGCAMDIIIRDPATLAFEEQEAKRVGKGSVLRMIAEGEPLCGEATAVNKVQAHFADVWTDGPNPMHGMLFYERFRGLHAFAQQCTHMSGKEKSLALYQLVHDAGTLHLSSQRQWSASGKIMGRYLPMSFKAQLEEFYASGHAMGIVDLVGNADKTLGYGSFYDTALLRTQKETQEDIKTKFLLRYSEESFAGIMTDGNTQQKQYGYEFIANKLMTVTDAVDRERLGRPSNEYFYALSRVVKTMAETVQVLTGKKREERYAVLTHEVPEFHGVVTQAEKGDPSSLKKLVSDFCDGFGEIPKPFIRYSPATFRAPPLSVFNPD